MDEAGQLQTSLVTVHPDTLPTDLCAPFRAPEFRQLSDAANRRRRVADLVTNDLLPRLLALHAAVPEPRHPTAENIGELARLVLASDGPEAGDYVTSLRDSGLTVDMLFTELLEPAAQRLGTLWDADAIDFVDVTLGVARLQALLAVFNCTHEVAASERHRSVLMLTVPGEQHSFGIAMVERFLTAGGWVVTSEREATAEQLAKLVRTQWFGVVGLTLSNQGNLDRAARAVQAIKQHSCNRAIGVMVGGPVFSTEPDLASDVGADGTAKGAIGAVILAQKLLDQALASAAGELRPMSRSAR